MVVRGAGVVVALLASAVALAGWFLIDWLDRIDARRR